MMRGRALGILSGIAMFSAALCAQESGRAVSPGGPDTTARTNLASIAFDKSLNTYHWTGLLFYNTLLGPLSLKIREQFLSTIIRAGRTLATDKQAFELSALDRLTDDLQAAVRVSSFVTSDTRSVGIGNAYSHGLYGGVAFAPAAGIILEPLVGVRLDRQLDRNDQGPSYLFGLSYAPMPYDTLLSGSYQIDQITPRRLETGAAAVSVGTDLFGETRNFFHLQYYRNRRDFYAPADSAIQSAYGVSYNIDSRADNSLALTDTLDYSAGERLLLTFGGGLLTREINRSTRYRNPLDARLTPPGTSIDEFRIEGIVRARWRPMGERFSATVACSYLERDEKHELRDETTYSRADAAFFADNEDRKNNHSRRTSLASSLQAVPWISDTLSVSASGSILRYDTPSSRNDDDRDELWYITSLAARHRFSRQFAAQLFVDVSLTHLVYLHASQSSNNAWNRILRLSPRFEYTADSSLSTLNTFEVLANYTAYDFDASSTESFLFRQFSFVDSTEVRLTRRLSLHGMGVVRLYERGELQWDRFAERLLNSYEEQTFSGGVRYAMTERLLFSVGIRYFNQLRYGHAGADRSLENTFRSVGPTATVAISTRERTEVSLSGWYERQTQTGQPDRSVTTMAMLVNIRI